MSDNREIAHHQGGSVAAAPASSGAIPMDQQLALVREALMNPDVDPAKATAMVDLVYRMEDRAREAQFNRDKRAAIREMPAIYKRGKSNNHRYAKFEDLHRAVMPVLDRHNLTLDFRIGSEGANITVQPLLRHDNGWVEEGGTMKGPPDGGGSKSAIQAVASAATYLKRHTMKAMLNIIEDGEDDDGAPYRAGSQMNDRQEGLLVDAQAAHDAGEYDAWFKRQTNKDRALLITSGFHAQLGGGTALPSQQQEHQQPAQRRDDPPTQEQRRAAPQQATTKHDLKTPEGFTAQFKEDCAAAATLNDLTVLKRRAGKGLGDLANGFPALYDEADAAFEEARERLTPADGGLL